MFPVNQYNVGRIAERIVANELEVRGFRVSDLNRDGTAANADLVAMRDGRSIQVQVKGASNTHGAYWLQYGYCSEAIIQHSEPMYNRRTGFYKADVVILVGVRSPKEYCCVVLPLQKAEAAAQLALDRDYRTPKRDGGSKKPNKVWVQLDTNPRARTPPPTELIEERRILDEHRDDRGWERLLQSVIEQIG